MSIPDSIDIPSGIIIAMTGKKPVDDEFREAADEIRREAHDAAAEIRIEFGATGRETRAALRPDQVGSTTALMKPSMKPMAASKPGQA